MIFKIISPKVPLNPVLFPTWKPTFLAEGHNFTDNIQYCDVVLFDLHTRIADYDQREIDELIVTGKDIATFDEWDRGNMSTDVWPKPLTKQQVDVMFTCMGKGVHFCRLLDKTLPKPENLYPYEKGIIHEEPMLSADDLFNRPFDITFIANSAPSRERLAQALRLDARLKCNIILGARKIPFNEWIDEHRKAKLFITASAGGFTDERMQALFSVSAMLREKTDQLLLHPFTHLENCLEVCNPPTKEDLDTIVEVVNNKERLYEIYVKQYNFVKTYYSNEYIAKDVLSKIIKHCS